MSARLSFVQGTHHPTFWIHWRTLLHNIDYQHPMYNPSGIIYYKNYFFHNECISDESRIILHNDQPIAGIIVSVSKKNNRSLLSGFGRGINFIEKHGIDASLSKSIRKHVREFVEDLKIKWKITDIYFRDYTHIDGQLSSLSQYFLDHGAFSSIWYLHLLDLTRELSDLKADISKSCRHSINRSTKLFSKKIIFGNAHQAVSRLRELHFNASAGVTRPLETWNNIESMIDAEDAFIVEGWHDGQCIASSLFILNTVTCLYSISAANRELFDLPVNHSLVWEAIQIAKSRGCRNFEFGSLLYSTNEFTIGAKEKNINRFKRNFGGSTHMQLELNLVL